MGTTAKWTLALGTVGWYFTPSVAEVPFGGPPLTRLSLFAFAAAWLLLFVVWPWRASLARGWFWTLAVLLLVAVGLKITAHQMAAPQGLVGSYRHLLGTADLAATARALSQPDTSERPGSPAVGPAKFAPPAWRRLDRAIQFADNGFSPIGDSFHLLHANRPPWSSHPKRAGPDGEEPSCDTLDGCGLLVTWRGSLDFPRQGIYIFQPRTDGWWSVEVEGLGVTDYGGPTPLTPGGPTEFHARRSFDPGPQPVVIRYLRPIAGSVPQPTEPASRFELRWDPPRGGDQPITWRRLHPDAVVSDDRLILNRVAEGLTWGAFGTASFLMLLTAIVAVDWPSVLRPLLSDRVLLFWLSVLVFGVGVLEGLSAAFGDPNWCTVAEPIPQRSLARAGTLYAHGQPESAEPRPRASARSDGDGGSWLERLWLGAIETLVGGRLGPTPDSPRLSAAFPDTPLHDYWLAGLLALTEERLGIVALVQTLIVVALVWLVYGLTTWVFGRVAGLWAALAVALDPHLSVAATVFTADLPAALLATLSVGLTLWAADDGRRRVVFTVGVLAALTVAMRPDLFLLPAVLLSWLLVRGDNPAADRFRRWAVVGLMLLPMGLLWSVVALRNEELTGQPVWWPTDWPRRAMDGNGLSLPRNIDGRPSCSACWGTVTVGLLEDPLAVAGQMWSKLLRVWGLGRALPTEEATATPAGLTEVTLPGLRYRAMPLLYLAVAVFAVGWVLRGRVPTRRPTGDANRDNSRDAGPAWLLALSVAAVLAPMVLLDFRDGARVVAIPLIHVFTGVLLARWLSQPEPSPSEPAAIPAEPAKPIEPSPSEPSPSEPSPSEPTLPAAAGGAACGA